MAMIWTDQTKEGSRRRKAINEEAAKRLAAFYEARCQREGCEHAEEKHRNGEGRCSACECVAFIEVEF